MISRLVPAREPAAPARYPGSAEIAVAGDQERNHEIEADPYPGRLADPYPGRPAGLASSDLRALIDRRQHAATTAATGTHGRTVTPRANSRAASAGVDQGGHRPPAAASIAPELT